MSPETKLILESIWKRDSKLTKLERELIQCLREGRAPVKLQQAVLPLDNYLPRSAVADKLSVSEVTVWRWEVDEELIPSYVTPDCPRYNPDEVADFVARRKGKKHSRKLKAAAETDISSLP